ncbi:hypothetical protein [Brevundimonas sp. AAP58]|uniref:hypothetical protein n=1 Tax=Brevundimonas sp. AAP58 TaxID=1523422 RepID=UPI0009EBE504|nr:hypothetical protein [Brevundimonas sp. AAP58]
MTVSHAVVAALLLATATLGGCATAPGDGQDRYTTELDRLTADCRARGGVLAPNGSATTGRPELDYACRITGATRLGGS